MALSKQMQEAHMQQLVRAWAQGETSLQDMLGLTAQELHAVSALAYRLFLEGKTQHAQQLFEGLVAICPHNNYYYRALGTIYWKLNMPQHALRQLDMALHLQTDDINSRVNRAEIYIGLNHFGAAQRDLIKALSLMRAVHAPLARKARAMLHMLPKRVSP